MLTSFLVLFNFIGVYFGFCYETNLYVPKWIDYLKAQDQLVDDLFKNYDSSVAPIYLAIDYNKPIGYDPEAPDRWNYTVFLYNLKLVEVQEPTEKVSVVMELMESWYDPRLSWNATKYRNVPTLITRQDKVWSPTLTAFGVNELVDFRDPDFRIVSIDSSGAVNNYLSVKISSNCQMDVSKFPFDSQTCQFSFCLPIFHISEVKVINKIYHGIQDPQRFKTMGNSEWKMINLTGYIQKLTYNDNYGNMDLSTFQITIQRNPLYYIYMIVFPSFVINFISIIGVFMKNADKMSKLNVGLTNIMTMTFILGVMADKIPRTGNIPLLGVYIIINLIIMIIAIAIVTLITELRLWALPRLKSKRSNSMRKLESFLGSPVEYTCAIILEILTTANFIIMIGFWIEDLQ